MGFVPDRSGLRGAFAAVLGAAFSALSLPSFAAGAGGDGLAPAKMLSGPSLDETGKIGPAKLEGAAPSKTMRAAAKLKARPEPPVVAPGTATAPAAPAGPKAVLPRAVQQQVTLRLHELSACRATVARDKHVAPAQLRAGTMLLRWTIGRDGTVSGTEVVEKAPVDPALLECVREAITKWTFPVPDGGPLPVERRYRFPMAR